MALSKPMGRSSLWTVTVVVAALGGVMLPMLFQHENLEAVFVSSNLALSGCLITVAGFGDFFASMIGKTVEYGDAMLLIGCLAAAAMCLWVYVVLTGIGPGRIDGNDIVSVATTFLLAVSCGTAAVYRAEAGR
jgi:hypothetical protein